ncbi:MAG: ATP cone domain-containing protein, partial [Candidatus Paceibacterota bacterium]
MGDKTEEKKVSVRRPAKLPEKLTRRDGSVVVFEIERIISAVSRAMKAAGEGKDDDARFVAYAVTKELAKTISSDPSYIPSVEDVQDTVESELMMMNFVKTAKAYILYRQKRADIRKEKGVIPTETRDSVRESKKYFRNQ